MKFTKLTTVHFIFVIILGVVVTIACVLLGHYGALEPEKAEIPIDKPQTVVEPSYITFETVAHIDASEFPDYERVWFDTETDRAVYIRRNYVPKQVCKVNDTVVFNGLQCTVVATDEQGIELQLPGNATAMYGMSGSIVTLNEVPIAMISRATSLSTVYAVYM